MSNNKQSSIEFLQECLSIHFTHEQQMQFDGLFQQAKEIHKEEIETTYEEGMFHHIYGMTPKEYSDETFNTKEK